MSLRTAMLPVADRLRALAGPDHFDIRTSRLVIVRREWTGGRIGADAAPGQPRYRETRLELPQSYRVEQVSTREVAGSGGLYEMGDIRVGPITPAYDGGGYSEEQLDPPVTRPGVETIYVVEGAHGGEYALVELRSMRAFGHVLVLRRRTTTP